MNAKIIDRDAELEAQIRDAFERMMVHHDDKPLAEAWFTIMVSRINQRSQRQVEQMEREKGLRV